MSKVEENTKVSDKVKQKVSDAKKVGTPEEQLEEKENEAKKAKHSLFERTEDVMFEATKQASDWASETTEKAKDKVSDAKDCIMKTVEKTEDAMSAATKQATDWASETTEKAKDNFLDTTKAAKIKIAGTLENASDYVRGVI